MSIPTPRAKPCLIWLQHQHVSRFAFLAAMLVVAAISLALRGDATPDVSWLITMCERVLNGERAYVDIVETTPPVPMLLYMPGAVIAKYIGGAPETWTFAFAYACAFGSLWLAARILPTYVTDGGRGDWLVLAPAAVALFLLPRDAFAQREYFAAAWALPMTAVFIRHAEDQTWPPLTDRVLAAILGGLTIAVKPPLFALPGILVGLYCWARTRILRSFSRAVWSPRMGLVVTAASLAAFPDYLRNMTGIMWDVYVPTRAAAEAFLYDRSCLGAVLCLGMTLILSLRGAAPAATISAMVAGDSSSPISSKESTSGIMDTRPRLLRRRRVRRHLPAVASAQGGRAAGARRGGGRIWPGRLRDRGPVLEQVRRWPARHARLVMGESACASPRARRVAPRGYVLSLARRIGAVWVGHSHSQWIARYTQFALGSNSLTSEQRERYLNYHRSDLEAVLGEIRDKRPEIIIEDIRPEFAWLAPELKALQPGFLDDYAVIADEGAVRVLRLMSPTVSGSLDDPPPDENHKAGR